MGMQPTAIEEALAQSAERHPALPDELALYARLEGLLGQERALLSIPRADRTKGQERLLGAISAELDRLWERLRERATKKEARLPGV
jgi:hypothetical protein